MLFAAGHLSTTLCDRNCVLYKWFFKRGSCVNCICCLSEDGVEKGLCLGMLDVPNLKFFNLNLSFLICLGHTHTPAI